MRERLPLTASAIERLLAANEAMLARVQGCRRYEGQSADVAALKERTNWLRLRYYQRTGEMPPRCEA